MVFLFQHHINPSIKNLVIRSKKKLDKFENIIILLLKEGVIFIGNFHSFIKSLGIQKGEAKMIDSNQTSYFNLIFNQD